MNIVMLTNTFTPHVGGVARSVSAFTAEYRRRGHRVLVVAPEFDNQPSDEVDVVRIPAIQHFNGSDFSAVLPVSGLLTETLDEFQPDIIHTHHPYLLGMTALRIARYRKLPLVFTHHTLYEQYTHYVPLDSPAFRRFVIELATRFANLCDQVFAPSESIAALLRKRDVQAPITVVPTGVDVARFAQGDGAGFRAAHGIPADAFVVGHLGRLAPEKNLEFLAGAVARFLKSAPDAHFLLVGKGPSESTIRAVFEDAGLTERLHIAGILQPPELTDAYHAMDVFAFASKSETQGMVLTEAMAAGVPVVGLDAPGVREVVTDQRNGRLLHEESVDTFAAALQWVVALPTARRQQLRQGARETAETFSMPRMADRALGCYEALIEKSFVSRSDEYEEWEHIVDLVKAQWDILTGMAGAASAAFSETGQAPDRTPP
jgi:glycosyltransferase involved in cell wall biosynthesis